MRQWNSGARVRLEDHPGWIVGPDGQEHAKRRCPQLGLGVQIPLGGLESSSLIPASVVVSLLSYSNSRLSSRPQPSALGAKESGIYFNLLVYFC